MGFQQHILIPMYFYFKEVQVICLKSQMFPNTTGGRQAGTRVLMDASYEHLSGVCESELPLDCSS